MATEKQRAAARKNVKKAQSGAREKRSISNLSKETRSALRREGAKAAARKRGASQGTGTRRNLDLSGPPAVFRRVGQPTVDACNLQHPLDHRRTRDDAEG